MGWNGNTHGFVKGNRNIDGRAYGWGKESNDVIKALIKAGATFIFDPSQGKNAPFDTVMVDKANKVGKNLFDPAILWLLNNANYQATNGTLKRTGYADGCSTSFVTAFKKIFKANTNYTISYTLAFVGTEESGRGDMAILEPAFERIVAGRVEGRVSATFNSNKILNTTNIFLYGPQTGGNIVYFSDFQVEEGIIATAYEPYARNNVLLTGFAGTTASGYDNVTMPGGKVVTMANLDGANDFGAMATSENLNPVGTDDFAQLAVFKPTDTTARYWGLSRNLLITTDTQYGFYANVGAITYFVGALSAGTFSHGSDLVVVIFGRINGRRFLNVNGTEVHEAASANAITSQPNLQLGCRSNSSDGLTKAAFSKGYQGLCAFFKGANGTLDKAEIIKASQRIVKQIYGL